MAGLLLLLGALPLLTGADEAARDGTYTVGIVPQYDSRQLFQTWRPILDAVEQRTGLRLRIRGAPSIPEFEQEFTQGAFDFAYMNPYHMVVARNRQHYLPLVRDHSAPLYGVLVALKDGPIAGLQDLQGKTVAFPAPNALGASLLMQAELRELHGISVQPRYVLTHSSVYLNVVLGEALAGGGVQKTLEQQPAEVRERLRIIYETRRVPPHPFAAHPRVPEAVQAQVRQALLDLGQTAEGKALLAKVPIDEIGPASFADYQPLEELGLERYYVEQ